jgi:hypothetical protein
VIISLPPSIRPSRRGTIRDEVNNRPVSGRKARPACSGLKPSTPCMYWVRKKNIPNIVPTSNSMVTYAATRSVLANSRSGTIGWLTRRSIATNATSSTTPTVKAASTSAEVQPTSATRMNP